MGSQLHVSTSQISGQVLNLYGLNIPVLVVDLVAISWGINDVQPQSDTIFRDDYEAKISLDKYRGLVIE